MVREIGREVEAESLESLLQMRSVTVSVSRMTNDRHGTATNTKRIGLISRMTRIRSLDSSDLFVGYIEQFVSRAIRVIRVFTAAFPRRVFGKRDRRAKGPRSDRA